MDDLLIILIRGAGIGSILSLMAMSANLIFNSSGILNFAHGHLFVAGGVMAFLALPAGSGADRWLWTLPLVVIGSALLATLQGWLALAPLKSSTEQQSWIITTLAASIVLGGVITIWMGPGALAVPNAFGTFPFAGTSIPWIYPGLVLLSVLCWAGLRTFQRRSMLGLTLNALSQDLDASRAMGASTRKLQILSFTIAGAILGITAHLAAPIMAINEAAGLEYATYGFIVLVLGGAGNNLGALVAGPIFGVLQMVITHQLGGKYQLALALVVIVVVLMFRPQGIFGRVHARKV